MIVLDTNVISEIMLPAPHPRVLRWVDQQPTQSIWITTVTLYEIRYGLQAMPAGKKQTALLTLLTLACRCRPTPNCQFRSSGCCAGRQSRGRVEVEGAAARSPRHHDRWHCPRLPRHPRDAQREALRRHRQVGDEPVDVKPNIDGTQPRYCTCADWEPCGCGNQPPCHCQWCCLELTAEQFEQARKRGRYPNFNSGSN